MTDQLTADPDEELHLVAQFLNGQLDAARVDVVRRRLDEDPAFRELAAPLLLAWAAPPRWQREPLAPGVLEKRWDEFSRRAQFVHQKRRTRRMIIAAIVVAIAAVGLGAPRLMPGLRQWYDDWRNFHDVEWTENWITFPNGAQVKLDPGATLRARNTLVKGGEQDLILTGSAAFRSAPADPDPLRARPPALVVRTNAGLVLSHREDFRVSQHGDTTEVVVLRAGSADAIPRAVMLMSPLEMRTLRNGEEGFTLTNQSLWRSTVMLREGQRGRIIAGHLAERLP